MTAGVTTNGPNDWITSGFLQAFAEKDQVFEGAGFFQDFVFHRGKLPPDHVGSEGIDDTVEPPDYLQESADSLRIVGNPVCGNRQV